MIDKTFIRKKLTIHILCIQNMIDNFELINVVPD